MYTDGASSGNPGPGGYGVVLKCGPLYKELSGGFIRTTNNRMGTSRGHHRLEAIKWKNADIEIWKRLFLCGQAINQGWLNNWVRKDFAKVKNPDLWKRFLNIYRQHHVVFHWLKGTQATLRTRDAMNWR